MAWPHCTFGKGCNEYCILNFYWPSILHQAFERKDFEIFLAGQAVLQTSQVSRLCNCIHE